MKFLKLIALFISVIVLFPTVVSATEGCLSGGRVYTELLGEFNPYGGKKDQLKYYSSVGASVKLYYGEMNNGYHCGDINVYPSSKMWDGQKNVTIPAQNEITSKSNGGCVISRTLGGGIEGYGDKVSFVTNTSTDCSPDTQQNLPLDDYLPLMLVAIAGFAAYSIYKNQLAFNF